ncbi:hypothetical protein F751_6901 [Auxenochlorella protothecoides]|uniref:Uncharacterized protein n=1 Tax=Auxenochlorella protothecoides TaxID=3075 RepID=A0A087SDX9_AUXPR|nr:hypothetical protein F751_6901 [Auxenochlorella protothecoides]KFM23933.1 hypothetical protein F751_6901 [Auxenochlorella protothecoides]
MGPPNHPSTHTHTHTWIPFANSPKSSSFKNLSPRPRDRLRPYSRRLFLLSWMPMSARRRRSRSLLKRWSSVSSTTSTVLGSIQSAVESPTFPAWGVGRWQWLVGAGTCGRSAQASGQHARPTTDGEGGRHARSAGHHPLPLHEPVCLPMPCGASLQTNNPHCPPATWRQTMPLRGDQASTAVAVHPSSARIRASVARKAGRRADTAPRCSSMSASQAGSRTPISSGSATAAASAAPRPQCPSKTQKRETEASPRRPGSGSGHCAHATSFSVLRGVRLGCRGSCASMGPDAAPLRGKAAAGQAGAARARRTTPESHNWWQSSRDARRCGAGILPSLLSR